MNQNKNNGKDSDLDLFHEVREFPHLFTCKRSPGKPPQSVSQLAFPLRFFGRRGRGTATAALSVVSIAGSPLSTCSSFFFFLLGSQSYAPGGVKYMVPQQCYCPNGPIARLRSVMGIDPFRQQKFWRANIGSEYAQPGQPGSS